MNPVHRRSLKADFCRHDFLFTQTSLILLGVISIFCLTSCAETDDVTLIRNLIKEGAMLAEKQDIMKIIRKGLLAHLSLGSKLILLSLFQLAQRYDFQTIDFRHPFLCFGKRFRHLRLIVSPRSPDNKFFFQIVVFYGVGDGYIGNRPV